MDPPPVQTFEQGGKLRRCQPHHATLNAGPLEPSLLELLGHETEARAVPPNKLDPVSPLGAKNIDHARKWIAAIAPTDQCRQGVRAFTKIHRTCCNHHPCAGTHCNHRGALRASMTAPMTSASAPRPIVTDTPSISSSTAPALRRRRLRRRRLAGAASLAVSGSTTAGTNDGSGAVGNATPRASSWSRSWRRQANSWFAASPCRRATPDTVSLPE